MRSFGDGRFLMTQALYAAHYADGACHERVTVLENVRIARDTFRVRFHCPRIARRIVPGQFVMVRLADSNDPLLGRPLALYDTVLAEGEGSAAVGIDIVYLVLGKMTGRLAKLLPGQPLEVWGPLGNGFGCGFVVDNAEPLVMVAGGIGQTPFLALAREALGQRRYGDPPRSVARAPRVTLCYGARTKDYLAGVDDFERLGVEVRVSTDDGSAGHHGLVTGLLEKAIADSPGGRVVCCGPERMMEAVAKMTRARGARCQVSLETPMACGIGICFSCVCRVRDADGSWDYRRTCVEGPVFDAERIEW
jgi:dihydroorotate dehydrogenase electron transfer subunit